MSGILKVFSSFCSFSQETENIAPLVASLATSSNSFQKPEKKIDVAETPVTGFFYAIEDTDEKIRGYILGIWDVVSIPQVEKFNDKVLEALRNADCIVFESDDYKVIEEKVEKFTNAKEVYRQSMVKLSMEYKLFQEYKSSKENGVNKEFYGLEQNLSIGVDSPRTFMKRRFPPEQQNQAKQNLAEAWDHGNEDQIASLGEASEQGKKEKEKVAENLDKFLRDNPKKVGVFCIKALRLYSQTQEQGVLALLQDKDWTIKRIKPRQ